MNIKAPHTFFLVMFTLMLLICSQITFASNYFRADAFGAPSCESMELVNETTIYCLGTHGLAAFSILDDGTVTVASNIDGVRQIYVDYPTAFMAIPQGDGGIRLWSYDITEPENPLEVDSVPMRWGQPFIDLAMKGSLLFVSGGLSGIEVFDVSDRENVEYLSYLHTSTGGGVFTNDDSVQIMDNLLYRSVPEGIQKFDITDPYALEALDTYVYADYGSGGPFVVEGDTLYMGAWNGRSIVSDASESELYLLDVSNPQSPVVVDSFDVDIWGVHSQNGRVFGHPENGMKLHHLNGENIEQDLLVNIPGLNNSEITDLASGRTPDELLISFGLGGIRSFDISNESEITAGSLQASAQYAGVLAAKDDYVYMAAGSEGTKVFYYDDDLRFQNVFINGFPADLIVVEGSTLFSVHGGVLTAFDLADPSLPAFLSELQFQEDGPHAYDQLLVKDGYAYVSSRLPNEVQIIDVSNPSIMGAVGAYEHGDSSSSSSVMNHRLVVVDDYLFLVVEEKKVDVINLENRSSPQKLGQYQMQVKWPGQLLAIGDQLIAVKGDDVELIDISNPQSPQMTRTFDAYNQPEITYGYYANSELKTASTLDGITSRTFNGTNSLSDTDLVALTKHNDHVLIKGGYIFNSKKDLGLLEVYEFNRAPIADDVDVEVLRNTAVNGKIEAQDPDGDTVSFSVEVGTGWSIEIGTTGEFIFMTSLAQQAPIPVQVSDGRGGQTTVHINVEVQTPPRNTDGENESSGSGGGGGTIRMLDLVLLLLAFVLGSWQRLIPATVKERLISKTIIMTYRAH